MKRTYRAILHTEYERGSRRGSPASPGLNWLRNHAWPLWLDHGVDWQRRAFHESLDPATLQCPADFRRLRVAARQTYVFSMAARYGVRRAREAVVLGLDFLQGSARLADGGFAWRFDLDNRPIDLTRDLYDHAFVLLAFAAAAEVVGADRLRPHAVALADYIASHFAHPAGGYRDSIPDTEPRRQNPHMHLFEALLAASDAFRNDIFFDRAREIADLFLNRLFQATEGALPEYFDDALMPRREAGRFLVEPGHHYEWIGLLDWYARSASAIGVPVHPDLTSAADSLFEFANLYGVHRGHGFVANSIWSDGTTADGGFRLWPQTERLRAVAGRQPSAMGALMVLNPLFVGVRPGLWIERMDADGQGIPDAAPATSLYHLTAAFTDSGVVALGGLPFRYG
jgi:mannose/cellobiose epimerase-like protein (N-acyl-D-glucosamine 2-epimerase family)